MLIFRWLILSRKSTGGAYIAIGDVNGDGTPDLVVGAGEGGGSEVQVMSGIDGSELASFAAYNPDTTASMRVAAGNLNGDGKADIVTGRGPGQADKVKVFSGGRCR